MANTIWGPYEKAARTGRRLLVSHVWPPFRFYPPSFILCMFTRTISWALKSLEITFERQDLETTACTNLWKIKVIGSLLLSVFSPEPPPLLMHGLELEYFQFNMHSTRYYKMLDDGKRNEQNL